MADLYKSYAQEAKAHGRASSTTKKPAPRTTDVILGEPVAEDTTASITAEMRPGCEEHAKMWDAMDQDIACLEESVIPVIIKTEENEESTLLSGKLPLGPQLQSLFGCAHVEAFFRGKLDKEATVEDNGIDAGATLMIKLTDCHPPDLVGTWRHYYSGDGGTEWTTASHVLTLRQDGSFESVENTSVGYTEVNPEVYHTCEALEGNWRVEKNDDENISVKLAVQKASHASETETEREERAHMTEATKMTSEVRDVICYLSCSRYKTGWCKK